MRTFVRQAHGMYACKKLAVAAVPAGQAPWGSKIWLPPNCAIHIRPPQVVCRQLQDSVASAHMAEEYFQPQKPLSASPPSCEVAVDNRTCDKIWQGGVQIPDKLQDSLNEPLQKYLVSA